MTENSEEELRPRPWSPSFDEQAVRKQLSSADVEQSILRAHLWVEHLVVELLNGSLPNPEALRADRLSFALKVELAVSLNLVPPELAPSLMCLNNLRNKAVHRLDYRFSDADKRALFDSISADVQAELLQESSFDTLSLPVLLRCLVFLLDSLRHFHEERTRIRREQWNRYIRDHGKTVERAFRSVGKKPPSWIYSQ